LYRQGNKLPSYIPSRTFSLALWNLATSAAAATDGAGAGRVAAPAAGLTTDLKRIREVVATNLPNQELKTALLALIDEANGDIDKARKNIEEWYDAMMDRVSGWYKRLTSVILLALGFAVAVVINADTITIAQTLARDSALRASIVGAAQERLGAPLRSSPAVGEAEARDRIATENLEKARASVDALGLPLGWATGPTGNNDPRRIPGGPLEWLLKILGLGLTGFAVSQGAPFWFDVLNKFIVIRSTVKPAEKSQTQPSKDRPAPRTEIEKEEAHEEEPSKG
jgi:hypothetical protein